HAVVFGEIHYCHTHRVPTHGRNIADPGSHDLTALAHHHEVVVGRRGFDRPDIAVSLARLDVLQALSVARLRPIFAHRRAFAVAVFGHGEQIPVVARGDDAHDRILPDEFDGVHAARAPAHLPGFVLRESDRHPL